MKKAIELAIKKYPRFAERRVGFIDGYEASVNDVVDWLQEHINDYLTKGRDIDLIFDDIREEFGLQPKFR